MKPIKDNPEIETIYVARYEPTLSPAVASLVANHGIKNARSAIKGSGPKGRILKVLCVAFPKILTISMMFVLTCGTCSLMCWPS